MSLDHKGSSVLRLRFRLEICLKWTATDISQRHHRLCFSSVQGFLDVKMFIEPGLYVLLCEFNDAQIHAQRDGNFLLTSQLNLYMYSIPVPIVLSVTNGQLLPSKIQGVTVTRTVQSSSPALRVSWSAVSGSGTTYTVCYTTTSGTQSDPPSNANCGTRGITGTSTTLGPLSRGTTYYIWVAAVSSGGRGPYSDRRQSSTYNGMSFN